MIRKPVCCSVSCGLIKSNKHTVDVDGPRQCQCKALPRRVSSIYSKVVDCAQDVSLSTCIAKFAHSKESPAISDISSKPDRRAQNNAYQHEFWINLSSAEQLATFILTYRRKDGFSSIVRPTSKVIYMAHNPDTRICH